MCREDALFKKELFQLLTTFKLKKYNYRDPGVNVPGQATAPLPTYSISISEY